MTRFPGKPRQRDDKVRGGIIFRLLFLMCCVGMFLVMYLARNPLLRLVGSFWIVDEEPRNSDVIVVLGDDNLRADRAARAAELFKSGFAPRVIASGRFLRPYATVSELEEHDLTEDGVPAAAVIRLAHNAADTREEAVAISRQLSEHGWKRVLLVTSNYHTRRSRYICERLFPPGSILRVVAAPDSDYNPDGWWKTRKGLKLFFHEAVGMPVAIWELRNNAVQTSEPGLIDSFRRRVSTLIPINYGKYAIRVYTTEGLYYIADKV